MASFLFTLFHSPLCALAQRLVDKINDLDTWIHSPDNAPGKPVPQHNQPYPIVQEGDNSAVLDPKVDHVAFPGEYALAHRNLRKLRKLLRKGILLALVESRDKPIAGCIMHNVIG